MPEVELMSLDPALLERVADEIQRRQQGGKSRLATEQLVRRLSTLLGSSVLDLRRQTTGRQRVLMKRAFVESGAMEAEDAFPEDLYRALMRLRIELSRDWHFTRTRGVKRCRALAKHLSSTEDVLLQGALAAD